MNYINKILLTFLLTGLVGFGFNSCTTEDAVTINYKSNDQFLADFGTFVKTEKTLVDSCVVGYNINNFSPINTTKFASYKANYLALLKADSILLAKPGVTMAELVLANQNLAYTGNVFKGKVNVCDKRVLNDSLVSANKLSSSYFSFSGFGVAANKVMQYDKSAYLSAILTATAPRDSATYAKILVDRALATLVTSRAVFVKAIIPSDIIVYKQNTSEFVNPQLALCYSVPVGFGVLQYVPMVRDNYLTALRKDSALIASPTTTVDALAAEMSKLTGSITQYYQKFLPSVSDRKILNDSVVSALKLYNNTPYVSVPSVAGQVPTYARTTFYTAITSATTKRDTPSTIDTDVSAAIFSLNNARLTFISLIKK